MARSKLKTKIGLKQILSGILTFMLVFTSIPITGLTTFAATEHQINGGTNTELRNAINNAKDGDTIVINGTVTMNNPVTVNKSITLKGTGVLCRTIFSSTSPMLGIESNANVTMEGITIDGGHRLGKAVVWITNGSSFTMNSGTIKNNTATGSGWLGGGVRNSGTFTMNGGIIKNNISDTAGGVYNSGTFTMNGGTISENMAMNVIGGVYNDMGTFTMAGGTITGNTSSKDSGGVENSGTFNMSGGTISKNTAVNGGGINNYLGTFNMTGGVVSENTASSSGGGVYNQSNFNVSGTAVIDGNANNDNVRCPFTNKLITVTGKFSGLIGVKQSADAVAVKAGTEYTLTQDDAVHFKADVNNDYLTLTNNTLVYKQDIQNAINNASSSGGSVSIDSTAVINKTVNISNNMTLKGKGTLIRAEGFKDKMLEIRSNANVTMEDITIDGNNIADSTGSAVYINSGSFTMNSGTIKNNTSSTAGGVYNNMGTFTMNGGTISGNTATNAIGGVYNYYGTFAMNSGTITGNTSNKDSGGVENTGTFNMSGGTISKNTAVNGGGINNCLGTFTMIGGVISENTASSSGGGVYNQSTFKMNDGTISGNSAGTSGSGLYLYKGTFEVQGTPTIGGNANNDNVGFYSENECITVTGNFSGTIGLKRDYGKIAVKAADGYTITQNDADHFFTEELNAHLELINNTLVYRGLKSKDIQDEIDNANAGDTITIDYIVFIDKTVNISKNITLKGKGTLLREEGFKDKMLEISSNANVTMEEITIDGNNVADSTGSAVYINKEASFTINSGIIRNNRANSGGGVYNEGTFKMNGGDVSKNTAIKSGGGVYNDGTFDMVKGTIIWNKAESYSGGISNQSIFTMTGGTITGNSSDKDSGGVGNSGSFTMVGGVISENTTKGNGAGVNNPGEFTMVDGVISGNTTEGKGGGIRNIGTLQISGGSVKTNTAQYGGGIYNEGTLKMTGGTIFENSASKLGGGLYINESTFEVQGTATIEDNGKNDNVRVSFAEYPIIISGEFNGKIKVNSEFGNVVVKPTYGYTMTQSDISCFAADGENAHLEYINNKLIYTKNKTEWGQMVDRERATYYINENGRASAEITDNGKVWLNTKSDGSGTWYCLDNSQGTFRIGSRFYVQVIDDISKYYDKIGSEYREKIEDGKLKIFLIGVIDPDGNEYTNLDTEINCYVKVDPNWDKDKLNAIFINGEKTEKIDIEYMGTIESPSSGDKFVRLTLKHFSPYAIYQAKDLEKTATIGQPTVNEESTLENAPATGENVNYGYIVGLSAMAIAALAAVIFIKKKFN